MTSEWVRLTDAISKERLYVNLANASSIISNGLGSEIWLLGGAGEGKVQVAKAPEAIFSDLAEVREIDRT
jgi:hypothetical protein